MRESLILTLVFVALLWLEWRYRLKTVRILTAFMALILWVFTQPNPTRAARRVLDMPAAERVTQIAGDPLSDFESGVRTMERAAGNDAMMLLKERLLGVGVLLWLACSPALRRASNATGKGKDPANEIPSQRSSRL